MNDRLRRYDSASTCGKWNATLVEDFRSDSDFIRTADELFSDVVSRHTNGECITSDGLLLETANIVFGASIDLGFRLDFLDGPDGYGMAPAKFSVATDTTHDDCMLATLCCGLREPDGKFWYPSTRRLPSATMSDDYEWAFSHTRAYGAPTISSWINRRTPKRGEP